MIIPAHNEEKTICKTVASLMSQDYSNFEIIVVDDGSDDDTGKNLIDRFGLCLIETNDIDCTLMHKPIVKVWNNKCNNIYLYFLQKENGGKGDALNAGIEFCHGDYFVCIDCGLVALIDESIQYFSGRAPQVVDIWYDILGAVFGSVIGLLIVVLIERAKRTEVEERRQPNRERF